MLIACCLYKYFPYGGLQRDFFRIAKEMVTRGHKVRVYVQQWIGDRPEFFEIIQVPVSSRTNHGQSKQFSEWVQKHLKKHPVDTVVGFNKMPGLDVYYAADVCYEEKVSQQKTGFLGQVYRLTSRYRHFSQFEREVFAKGKKTKILMISESEIKYFKKHYGTEDNRFILLPPGIDQACRYINQPEGTREQVRLSLSISKEQIVLLQVGSNYKLKGVDRSLLGLSALSEELKKKVVYLVVGQDDPSKFKTLAHRLGVENNVRFLGPRNDVPSLMTAADIYVHPAYFENTGTVLLEALVAGLPLLVSGNCGYSFYVNQAQCGSVVSEPFDQGRFNEELNRLIVDEKQRIECALKAKRFSDTQDLYSLTKKATDIILGESNLS